MSCPTGTTEGGSVGIVVITHNRATELAATLDRLTALDDRCPVVVVDNASSDGTRALLARRADVTVLHAARNLGAAARNLGAQRLDTRYVAFCDDDAWWTPGSLRRAAGHLDRNVGVAAVCAAVAVRTPDGAVTLDPTSAVMAVSPLPARPGQPGPRLVGLLASATVVRRELFLAVGGFDGRFGVGGEEALLALDLLDAGWDLCFAPDCVLVHQPSPWRSPTRTRRRGEARNRFLTAWLRTPRRGLPRATLRAVTADTAAAPAGLLAATRLLPTVRADRRAVRGAVVAARRAVDRAEQRGPRRDRAIAWSLRRVRQAGNGFGTRARKVTGSGW